MLHQNGPEEKALLDFVSTFQPGPGKDYLDFSRDQITASIRVGTAIAKRGAFVNCHDDAGRTPLIYAVLSGAHLVVGTLCHYGADVNFKDKAGKSALDYARENPNKEVTGAFEKHARNVAAKETIARQPVLLNPNTTEDYQERAAIAQKNTDNALRELQAETRALEQSISSDQRRLGAMQDAIKSLQDAIKSLQDEKQIVADAVRENAKLRVALAFAKASQRKAPKDEAFTFMIEANNFMADSMKAALNAVAPLGAMTKGATEIAVYHNDRINIQPRQLIEKILTGEAQQQEWEPEAKRPAGQYVRVAPQHESGILQNLMGQNMANLGTRDNAQALEALKKQNDGTARHYLFITTGDAESAEKALVQLNEALEAMPKATFDFVVLGNGAYAKPLERAVLAAGKNSRLGLARAQTADDIATTAQILFAERLAKNADAEAASKASRKRSPPSPKVK